MRLSAAPDRDVAERDALVLAHLDLVRSLAGRLWRRVPSHVEVSELVSAGVVGLIDAARRYQPTLGVPFDAFARRRVQGAMLDSLRSIDLVPRSLRRRRRDLEAALQRLRAVNGCEPEAEEIAEALGLTTGQYFALLDDLRWTEVAAVGPAGQGGALEDLMVAVDPEHGPAVRLERRELRAHLVRALKALPDRERTILALSYEHELTLAEIGRLIGVGESRVSQLRTQAVARLRSLLSAWIAPVAEAGR